MRSLVLSIKGPIVIVLGIALVLGSVPSSLQLFYLPVLYERSEQGEDVERQWSVAERVVEVLSPVLQIESLGRQVPSWGTHGFMRSWQYRRPWIVMYFANAFSWWCILHLVWLSVRRVQDSANRRRGATKR